MADEYMQDWDSVQGGEPATGDDYSIIEGSPPNIADLYDWSTVDAGFPGVPELTGISEGRPPVEDQSAPDIFYWSLDPDAPENTRNVTPFTKLAYSFLPEFFKTADQRANTQEGGWPMLRFLDAPGHVADNIRATVDDMHRGKWTDPKTVPDRAVPWLASVLGVPQSQKNVPNPQLRQVLVDMVENGRAPTGTRSELANAAKQFLTGSKEILVAPQASQARALNQADLDLAAAVGYGGRVVNVHSTPVEPVPEIEHSWEGTAHASASQRHRHGNLDALNLVPNPAFEYGGGTASDWSNYMATITVNATGTGYRPEARSMTITQNGTSDGRGYTTPVPVTGGTDIIWSVWVRSTADTMVAADLFNYDNEFGSGASVDFLPITDVTLTPNTWTQITIRTVLDPTVITVRGVVRLRGTANTTASVDISDPVIAPAYLYPAPYFDGSFPDSTADDLWVDEDNAQVHTWADGWTLYTATDPTALAQTVITTRETERLTRAHTIVVLVRPDDVPAGDLAAFAANLRNVGVVPAGHALQIVTAAASWANWEQAVADLGGTWNAVEAATTTWASEEALGLGEFGGA